MNTRKPQQDLQSAAAAATQAAIAAALKDSMTKDAAKRAIARELAHAASLLLQRANAYLAEGGSSDRYTVAMQSTGPAAPCLQVVTEPPKDPKEP